MRFSGSGVIDRTIGAAGTIAVLGVTLLLMAGGSTPAAPSAAGRTTWEYARLDVRNASIRSGGGAEEEKHVCSFSSQASHTQGTVEEVARTLGMSTEGQLDSVAFLNHLSSQGWEVVSFSNQFTAVVEPLIGGVKRDSDVVLLRRPK